MAGVSLLVFGFLERIGVWHGFTGAPVAGVLIAAGLVSLFASVLSGILERRLSAARVVCLGPALQGVLGLAFTQSQDFAAYAVAASMFIAVLIFAHAFAFGFLAREERSGRAVAVTPAMIVTGSACGPPLGSVLAQQQGHGTLGWAALVIGLSSALSFRGAARPREGVRPARAAA